MALGFETPLTADARMQDLLQRAFLSRVGEHYGADPLSIQALTRRINLREFARRDIRIEKHCIRNKLAQTAYETRFPGGNPARYPDCWHILFAWEQICVRPFNEDKSLTQTQTHNAFCASVFFRITRAI